MLFPCQILSPSNLKKLISSILSSSYDKAVCVSDVETGAPIWKAKHPGLVTCADVSPDDKLIVASSDFDYSLYFWDFRIGKPAYKIPGD